ncbi:ATP-binding protein [Synechococcus sp. CBW1006]|uniref:ATP-binding protein n=1 Tax=Synechococcus sp. CBW1006 TaxID=1353138 RepID=UPI0018CCC448|nr:ATP-binding protein [Synechococcus sp. CBW1006]QPN66061.1 ATP-binding protein [Synechococcus sp. CBW1006]
MALPGPGGDRERRFASHLDAIAELLDWFEQQQPAGVDPMVWIQAQTALVEAFTNAVRHAHATLLPPPEVVVRLDCTSGTLRLCIHDQGDPFDMEAAWSEPEEGADSDDGSEDLPSLDDDGLPILPMRDAHWGLIMLRKLQQDFGWSIRYDGLPDGGNVLVLEHPLD